MSVNSYLNQLADSLQAEADVRVDAALKTFDSLSEEGQQKVLGYLKAPDDITRTTLRDLFDTLELIDELETLEEFMGNLLPKH